MDEEAQVTEALTRSTMQDYEAYRAMGEPPAFALREAIKRQEALIDRAKRAAYHTALQANYRDIEELRQQSE